MLSLAAKSHWKLAFKAVSKAIKVTLQDIRQVRKANSHINNIQSDLYAKRRVDKLYGEEDLIFTSSEELNRRLKN